MRIICAPDSFKESLAAAAVAAAMAEGIRDALPDADVDLCPIADGGEGTVDALLTATHGSPRTLRVLGPLGEMVNARWGMLGDVPGQPRTAVIEMAAASGLPLVPAPQRDPTRTTTFGTGQLIAAALDEKAQRIILGIGGSATNDGGCGAAQALGVRFHDEHDQPITEPITGGMLHKIACIDLTHLDPRLTTSSPTPVLSAAKGGIPDPTHPHVELIIACDVTNPLTGPHGAALIYGPQKGATPEQVAQLDAGLAHLATLIRHATGQNVDPMPGAGAAGGLGAGAVALLNGTLRRGAELVLEAAGFEQRVRGCDLCLTGEGKLDGQSLAGKAILTVAAAAAKQGVKTIALVGCLGEGAERTRAAGLHDYMVIGEGLPMEESIARAAELLRSAAAKVAGEWGTQVKQ